MEKDWVIVYTVDKSYKTQLALEILNEQSIQGVVIDKKDSAYLSFGDFEIYVNKKYETIARELLQKSNI